MYRRFGDARECAIPEPAHGRCRADCVRIGHALGVVSEHLEYARFGSEDFVIRAEPTGMPQGLASLSIWVELAVRVRRLITRERSWTVRVRRRSDDRFGEVVHDEIALDETQARTRVVELKEDIRVGRLPSTSS